MTILTVLQFIVNIIIVLFLISGLIIGALLLFKDKRQKQHSVLRNYPLLARIRYFGEKIGPELRQYLFLPDTKGKPFSRNDFTNIVLAGKYNSRMTSFGTQRDYEDGFYIQNTMFPLQSSELHIDQSPMISSFIYQIDNERLFDRDEHRIKTEIDPYYLSDDNQIILGPELEQPFKLKRLVGQSGMSYGALGSHAITALSKGLGQAGTWMNTGEGGLSKHHLSGDVDIIFQIGPGLFGVRDKQGNFDTDAFRHLSQHPRVKAFEIKLAQGAKTRGGHMQGNKVTEEIAEIRKVEPWKTINSPNRFDQIDNPVALLSWVHQLQQLGQKPVGFKIVISKVSEIEDLVRTMVDTQQYPNFITIDGGEGGTGATFQELEDGVGLPLFTALPILTSLLEKYDLRDRIKIFASGKLITPDKIAIALGLGADLINIARGMMISVGCIMSQQCHMNTCPVGVATTDPKREKGLIIDEKKYRVTNFVTSLHEGLFNIAAAVGVESPTQITKDHIIIKNKDGSIQSIQDYKLKLIEHE
ncbi:FMN-binding glutamate synthase family protein [Staphylococcus xylosus]|uniref:FMN-binding glutamate synthase family protein n=1 Tax=Staphylococcus xylosus TaxID=1288 RepID=A0AAQ0LYJ9_STAXY|nr:FMN-binding glutamate synthase family protein [Staphylococcus xylosus]MCE7784944.1 FMN-binding glutamate synthase family protein [Staphylococcus xylosus]MCM3519016.1 FMN-binding glutamate synthase family protein [Staphylococcus xylosus]MCQ3816404.1 FMN-binding glutamate synthase family protein [Staphylococcus xylosus]MCQ3819107.1 FMN-binding glutamate synthase family protein [Staphylococcus xylosus]RIM66307.1 FMN-binding glutamate synthase family protein [Staphylococcus xylosus]